MSDCCSCTVTASLHIQSCSQRGACIVSLQEQGSRNKPVGHRDQKTSSAACVHTRTCRPQCDRTPCPTRPMRVDPVDTAYKPSMRGHTSRSQQWLFLAMLACPKPRIRAGSQPTTDVPHCTIAFESTPKVLAERMLRYYRVSQCIGAKVRKQGD